MTDTTGSKPIRIRYMELPGEINPDTNQVSAPFIIIIDRWDSIGDVNTEEAAEWGNKVKTQTGAQGVLMFPFEVQIGDD